MAEHPILFSGEMVRAILDDRKAQTRRVMKQQPPGDLAIKCWCDTGECCGFGKIAYDEHGHIVWPRSHGLRQSSIRCPYGDSGDKLWLRECWKPSYENGPLNWHVLYRADGARIHREAKEDKLKYMRQGWRSSIHMPRWASRLTLEVVEVRVQRVQEISAGDCEAEGVEYKGRWFRDYSVSARTYTKSAHASFRSLWDSINGKKHPWDSNPWIRAVTFKRLTTEATED